jgi:hypothetical protein
MERSCAAGTPVCDCGVYFSSLPDSPAGVAPMPRPSPLLFVIVISTPLPAQSESVAV